MKLTKLRSRLDIKNHAFLQSKNNQQTEQPACQCRQCKDCQQFQEGIYDRIETTWTSEADELAGP